ncbi:MAG: hypothetical protein ACOC8B_01400 [Gemmatimonadota bacterium]
MDRGTTIKALATRALRRPRLWPLLVRAAWRFRRRDWYRRPPFLPVPPPKYLAWRLQTAYGDAGAAPTIDELERYLRWAERMDDRRHGRRNPGGGAT